MDNVLPISPGRSGPQASDRRNPVQVIAVAAGKGGVGKTTVSINLALALGRMGRKAMLLDADLGLANVDTLLGLQPSSNLSHVLAGECSLADIVMPVYPGVELIPAASGVARMSELSAREQAGIIGAFDDLTTDLDVLIVDNAPGISSSSLRFSAAAHEVIVVVCDEPASITDAYAVIKVLSREHGVSQFNMLVNKTDNATQADEVFYKINRVAEKFLDVTLNPIGEIPRDIYLQRSIQEQASVVLRYPGSASAKAFHSLAKKTLSWPVPSVPRGHVEFFVERSLAARTSHPGGPARPTSGLST